MLTDPQVITVGENVYHFELKSVNGSSSQYSDNDLSDAWTGKPESIRLAHNTNKGVRSSLAQFTSRRLSETDKPETLVVNITVRLPAQPQTLTDADIVEAIKVACTFASSAEGLSTFTDQRI